MLFTKDGIYMELVDPAHIDAFVAAGWEKAVRKTEKAQEEPSQAPKAAPKRGRPAKR